MVVSRVTIAVVLAATALLHKSLQDVAPYRLPVAHGKLYPAEPAKLRAAVEQYLQEAPASEDLGDLRAVIAPHASYRWTGSIMGAAFKGIEEGEYDRVVVMTASHYAEFNGISVPAAEVYLTPLAGIKLDGHAINLMSVPALVDVAYVEPRPNATGIHEREHAVEVVLPFLQAQLGTFSLVPIVVGDITDFTGDLSKHNIHVAAEALRKIMDDRTLVIVTTHLTRFGSEFGYKPFDSNTLEQIDELDQAAIDLIVRKDVDGLIKYARRTGNVFDGFMPLLVLLEALPAETEGTLAAYNTTGRMANRDDNSVSYAAIRFYTPRGTPAAAGPDG